MIVVVHCIILLPEFIFKAPACGFRAYFGSENVPPIKITCNWEKCHLYMLTCRKLTNQRPKLKIQRLLIVFSNYVRSLRHKSP